MERRLPMTKSVRRYTIEQDYTLPELLSAIKIRERNIEENITRLSELMKELKERNKCKLTDFDDFLPDCAFHVHNAWESPK